MSKSALNTWDTAYIGPLAVCINQYFHCFIGEHVFLWLFLVSKSFVDKIVNLLIEQRRFVGERFVTYRRKTKYVKVKKD